ncbi:hypothetical protein FOA43_001668 [Brettanomyces nanus]|uniref:Chromatin modification-related protein EAF3 n=1 Tax=Eeniella nana TaxID=13502 RepID=A0A875RXW7_EENNA|nr:uncharacterized protein FOA43_001668 [Brettanomyces nanus]QPG74341.1 hypothetical protein FOA43_001668 [Brettanomyces nanus]
MSSFQLNDIVLVFQGPLLYDSKILKIYYPETGKMKFRNEKVGETLETKPDSKFPDLYKDQKAYFIHYQGWNNKWNEWVMEDRILERTTENLLFQKNLKLQLRSGQQQQQQQQQDQQLQQEQQLERQQQSAQQDHNQNGHHKHGHRGKLRLRIHQEKRNGVKTTFLSRNGSSHSGKIVIPLRNIHGHSAKRHEMNVSVPTEIKLLLVKDWENITRNEKLVSLPSKSSANKVLKDFSKKVCREDFADDVKLDNYLEIIESLKMLFNQSLGTLLLYRYEREQYKEMIQKYDRLEFSEIYSPIFLLRLCSILPNLMVQSHMDLQSMNIVKEFIEEFYEWLCDHSKIYMIDEYENCMPLIPFMQ